MSVVTGESYMTTTAREHLLPQAERIRWLPVFIEFVIAVKRVGG
ncbi:MAG TPA: hypothetical protein VNB88_03725 [Gaiellaceae bacterium]|nr:hypothetical protein [Gaiellaceae bacterium]